MAEVEAEVFFRHRLRGLQMRRWRQLPRHWPS